MQPSIKGGIFRSIFSFDRPSLMVKPRSAIIETPSIPSSFCRKPQSRVRAGSELSLQPCLVTLVH